MHYANITGWGKCLPPAILTNDEISNIIETDDEWIKSRTGILERRITHVNLSELARIAALEALAAAGKSANDVEFIIMATTSGDYVLPCTAAIVQENIGAKNSAAVDINAACTGFLYGLQMATCMIKAGAIKSALVIGADRLTHYMNVERRDSAVIFGDGAGAVYLEVSDQKSGLLEAKLGCDSSGNKALHMTNVGTATNRYKENITDIDIHFLGKEVFKKAVSGMGAAITQVMNSANLTNDDINLLIPHQANKRIIDALATKLNCPSDKVIVNIQNYGNTSAASIPIALTEALEQGRINPGDEIITAAFGSGLTWGAGHIKWGERVIPLQQNDEQLPPCEHTGLQLLKQHLGIE